MRRHEISDEQWDKVKDLLPGKPGDPGRTARDNRSFLRAYPNNPAQRYVMTAQTR